MDQRIRQAVKARLAQYQRDPVLFAREALGVELWGAQRAILMALADPGGPPEVAVRSCHSVGKSLGAAVAVLWFLYCHRPSKVISTAPTDRQVAGILWSEIGKLHREARRPLGGTVLTQELHLDPEWFAWGFTAPAYDPDRFQGFHSPHILVVMDEASGISPKIYEAVKSVLTGSHSRLLMLGNPTDPTGSFARAFDRQGAAKFHVSAFDTPNFTHFGITVDDVRQGTWASKVTGPLPAPYLATPQWARSCWEEWGEDSPMWAARVLGEFPREADDALVPMPWVVAANERWHALEQRGWTGPAVVGLDVARMGEDSTVAAEGVPTLGCRRLHKRQKQDTVVTTQWIGGLVREAEGIYAVHVDADGLGAGVYDALNHHPPRNGVAVVEMRGGMAASEPGRFVNRRAEWLWNLRTRLDPAAKDAIALPPDDRLAGQLTTVRWTLTPKGLIQIESKDDLRKRGLGSPDELDAVAYMLATPPRGKVQVSAQAVPAFTTMLARTDGGWG